MSAIAGIWGKVDAWLERHAKVLMILMLLVQASILIFYFCLFYPESQGIAADSQSYIAPAESFLEKGVMMSGDTPIWFRTPGYPFFLAIIYALSGHSNLCVIFLQNLMCLAITGMIYWMVSQFTSKSFGLLAAFFFICDMASYNHASLILTDVPFAFWMTLALFCFVKFLLGKKKRYAVFSIILLQYAMLVRPAIMYLNLLIAAVLVILIFLKKINWKLPLLYILLFAVTFGGWSARNAYYFGRASYTPIRSESYYNWYAPLVYEEINNVSSEEAKSYFQGEMERKYPDYDSLSMTAKVDAKKDIGGSYLKEHVAGYLRINVEGLFKEMVGPSFDAIRSYPFAYPVQTLLLLFHAGMLALSYLIYAVLFLYHVKRRQWFDWMLFLITAYLMASTAVLGYSRFRLAFYPICLVGTFTCWKQKSAIQ